MKIRKLILLLFLLTTINLYAQKDSVSQNNDSINVVLLNAFNQKLAKIEQQRIVDSLQKDQLEKQISTLRATDDKKRLELEQKLKEIEANNIQRIATKKAQIDSLRKTAKGYPVLGAMQDTLFLIYTRTGAYPAKERAKNITAKIERLYHDDFLKIDSIAIQKSDNTFDIVYGELIVMSVSEVDALWNDKEAAVLANELKTKIVEDIAKAKDENSFEKLATRIGLVLLVLAFVWSLTWLVRKVQKRVEVYITSKKATWLKPLSYKDYTFLSPEQEIQLILFALKIFWWVVYAILAYITLPIVFSIFPFSRGWADELISLILEPLRGVFGAVLAYLPNLFRIIVIYYIMKMVIRFIGYIFTEIDAGKLKIDGFYQDWALPTYSIVKFLLYAFSFILIFPYLPGSDSEIFKGVSVFLGVLFSLGSSTALSNAAAGIVITYMRPFKVGDFIKLDDVKGVVVEATLLVTRVKTIKNEVITIPNSSVLSGNTVNYTVIAQTEGLIINTTITIGYDVPWKTVHQALLNAADRTQMLEKTPKPFVFQTSLDDYYVAYQINAHTKESNKQMQIYSNLHQHIQDCCNELGIEILSPHYRAVRDGNMNTMPADYLPKDYKAPSFNVDLGNKNDGE